MKKNIQLIEACSDLGAGTRGASFGNEALQQMAQRDTDNLFQKISTKTCRIPLTQGYSSSFARNIETIYQTCHSIANEVHQAIIDRYFPVIISGDHSCAAGTIAGIKMAKPNSRLGVIWIDAHADLHSPFTTPSGNMHGMPLAASIATDNKTYLRQEIDLRTSYFWNKLKKLGNIVPKILPQDIVYVSLRDLEAEEAFLIRTHGIKVIPTATVRRCGISGVVDTIFRQLAYCSHLYISFDADCLDASLSRGTGLPVHGGLTPHEAELLLLQLAKHPALSCLEFTELNPFFDTNNQTTTIIYHLLKREIAALQRETASVVFRQ